MYISFFGFRCKPFQLTPDPEFLFMSKVHKRALTYLNYGIRENFGFILVTGEIGTGKTTIIRTLLKQIPQEIKVARINNTRVTSDQLLSMINEDFGLETRGKDKSRMLGELADFLISHYAEGGRAMIIIDEAQNLSPEILEEVRLLSNLETDKSKLLQIILIGQPGLSSRLSRDDLEQLRQRITISTHISPLGREETEDYIKHRLKVAGNIENVRFEKGVMDVLFEFSKGIPRLINIICEFSLLAAFTDRTNIISLEIIRDVAQDLANERPESRAAALNVQPSNRETDERIRKIISSIHLRLQNLEAGINEIYKALNKIGGYKNRMDGTEPHKNENDPGRKYELHKREYLRKIMFRKAFGKPVPSAAGNEAHDE